MQKEIKEQYKAKLGEKISEAYIEVRKLIIESFSFEIYKVENELSIHDVMDARDQAKFPSFMRDVDSLSEFVDSVTKARTHYEQYLDLKSAAFLYALETYLLSLMAFMRDNKIYSAINEVGCLIILDIVKWGNLFDHHIVKRINSPSCKLYSKTGNKWQKEKAEIINSFVKESFFNKYIKGQLEFPLDIFAIAACRDENDTMKRA